MKNKDMSSSCCNNCRKQSSKRFGHNIETCYHRNKSAISISAANIANTESVQPMAPISAQSKSSRRTFTISTFFIRCPRRDLSPYPQMTLKTSLLISFVWLVIHLIPLLSQLYLICLLPLGLWILLVAIT